MFIMFSTLNVEIHATPTLNRNELVTHPMHLASLIFAAPQLHVIKYDIHRLIS